MKQDINMRVCGMRRMGNGSALIQVMPADGKKLGEIIPGQFVNIMVPDTNGVFLRRPISVCDVSGDLLTLYVKPQGKGSRRLVTLSIGDEMRILLPLGNGFNLSHTSGVNLLVGGGVGMAPLLYLGRALVSKGAKVEYLLGGASLTDMEMVGEFEQFGAVHVTTVDGSMGTKGFVTDHEIFTDDKDISRIYSCGPTPMMKAVAAVSSSKNIPMQASLENHMACGLGACLCCVEDTKEGHVCVCTDGPVFDIDRLKW